MTKIFFVTATGTDIGKTFVMEKLCADLVRKKEKVEAIKPIISGFNDDDLNSDTAKILTALGKEINLPNIKSTSPWRFKEPVSPNIAAQIENRKIDFLEVVNFCKEKIARAKENDSYLFIEGAGGVMSPVNDEKTFLDLISALEISVILVVGDYLGTISHSLTAIKVLQAENIKIERIIFNSKNNSNKSVFESLRKLTNCRVEIQK